MKQELLDSESVIGSKSLYGPVNVAVGLALGRNNVLIGICKALHDEYSVCKLKISVTVSVAPFLFGDFSL